MSISLFLCTLEHVLEMTPFSSVHFWGAVQNCPWRPCTQTACKCQTACTQGSPGHHRPQESQQGGDESPASVCVRKYVMDNFVRHVKKCTKLNRGHLEHIFTSTQEQTDRHHVMKLYLYYSNLFVCEHSFNFNGNLRNDAYQKLGPVFLWITLYVKSGRNL